MILNHHQVSSTLFLSVFLICCLKNSTENKFLKTFLNILLKFTWFIFTIFEFLIFSYFLEEHFWVMKIYQKIRKIRKKIFFEIFDTILILQLFFRFENVHKLLNGILWNCLNSKVIWRFKKDLNYNKLKLNWFLGLPGPRICGINKFLAHFWNLFRKGSLIMHFLRLFGAIKTP